MSEPTDLTRLVESLPTDPVLAVGGTALNAKPLAALRQLCSAGLPPAEVYTYAAGLDAEYLLAAKRVHTLRAAYVGLERFGKLPARDELDGRFVPETFGSLIWGMEAELRGTTFLPGYDMSATGLAQERELTSVTCPFTGRTFTAWPAIRPDLGVIHARAVTPDGFVLLDSDLGIERLIAKTSARLVVSVEVPADEAPYPDGLRLVMPRARPTVLLTPGGAGPGGLGRVYEPDETGLRAYASLPDQDARQQWWEERSA
jgi:glutaconate CoA-transferase, subunit A